MVAVYDTKELLGWYLITLKLRETLQANLPRTSTSTASAAVLRPYHQQQPQQLPQLFLKAGIGYDSSEETSIESESHSLVSIQDRLEQARQDNAACRSARLSIYRIAHYLKDDEDKAYNPQIVSLGPYHHGKEWLHPMQRHKWRLLHQVLRRTGHDITLYLDEIKELEDSARACYEGYIPLDSNKFIKMMVLDGCFILELFRGMAEGFEELGYPRNDAVFSMRGSMHSIQQDMIMLENQIPMLILDRLLRIQLGKQYKKGLVAKLALWFFYPLTPTDPRFASTFDPLLDYQRGLHCLDVFRRNLLSSGRKKPVPTNLIERWSIIPRVADKRKQLLVHCVTELREAGIEVREQETDRFWDIKFENWVLYIPRLLIHDGTRTLFLNLIAFEQSHLDCSNEVTSYAVFMDNLINSPMDVAHLHNHRIIEHWLRSDAEVVDLFNQLCQEVVFDINYSHLLTVSKKVNDAVDRYNEHRWNAWRASLERNYFSSPWSIISLIAAVVLLLLTLVQTFYGVYGYYWPAGS